MIDLDLEDYAAVLAPLRAVPFNTHFAAAVLRRHLPGRVYADRREGARAWLVAHPCGMSLLFGDSDAADFLAGLRGYVANATGARRHPEVLQCHPETWPERIRGLVDGRYRPAGELTERGLAHPDARASGRAEVIEWSRLNFRFVPERFRSRAAARRALSDGLRVARLDGAHFATWTGAVMPREFWASAEDYGRRGTAFGVLQGEEIVSLAFSAMALDRVLEVGIETKAAWQGRGLALHAGAALIEDCLARGLAPVWACRAGNAGSRRAAEALGFEVTRAIPYLGLMWDGAEAEPASDG